MRLRRRSFHASVRVQSGHAPILVHLGLVSFEASVEEARQLALDLADAVEAAERTRRSLPREADT
jgi:hypothetical protein